MNLKVVQVLTDVPAGRVFALDLQTLISVGIQLLNACILAIALGFILYKPIQEFMGKRADRIQGQLKDAQDKMAEADMLKVEYEKKMKEINAERMKILEAARIAATEKSKHILEEARHEAATIRRRTEESIAHEKERLQKETKLHIVEVSSLMAAKFMEQNMDGDAQNRLFEEAMAELEASTWLS